MLEKDIKKVLVSHDEIVEAAKKLGETLTKEYQGKNPIFVGILKGSVPFMAELINHVDTHIELDFMLVSSYHGGTASSGIINIIKDIDQDITGRDILFVEDIICFTIPNEFVVGYGLDYDENYRNLPYVGVLKEEVYSK